MNEQYRIILTGNIPEDVSDLPESVIVPVPLNLGWEPEEPEGIDELQEKGAEALLAARPSYHLDNEIYFPLFERAEELRIPVIIESGIFPVSDSDAAGCVSADKTDILRIDALTRCFPKLPILIVHHEFPGFSDALLFSACRENVWFSIQAKYTVSHIFSLFKDPQYLNMFCAAGILTSSAEQLGSWPEDALRSLLEAGAEAGHIEKAKYENCIKFLTSSS